MRSTSKSPMLFDGIGIYASFRFTNHGSSEGKCRCTIRCENEYLEKEGILELDNYRSYGSRGLLTKMNEEIPLPTAKHHIKLREYTAEGSASVTYDVFDTR